MLACILLSACYTLWTLELCGLKDNREAHLNEGSKHPSKEEDREHIELILIIIASLFDHLFDGEAIVPVDPVF